MRVKIDGEMYDLNFGVGFVRELDQAHKIEGAVEFGTGVTSLYARLHSPNPYALYEAMHAALQPELELTEEMFDRWVDSFKTEREYTNFFDLLLKEFKKQRQTKPLIRNYEQVMAQITKKQQKMQEKVQNSTKQ